MKTYEPKRPNPTGDWWQTGDRPPPRSFFKQGFLVRLPREWMASVELEEYADRLHGHLVSLHQHPFFVSTYEGPMETLFTHEFVLVKAVAIRDNSQAPLDGIPVVAEGEMYPEAESPIPVVPTEMTGTR